MGRILSGSRAQMGKHAERSCLSARGTLGEGVRPKGDGGQETGAAQNGSSSVGGLTIFPGEPVKARLRQQAGTRSANIKPEG